MEPERFGSVTIDRLVDRSTIFLPSTKDPVLLPRITFGRYRGRSWTDVPEDYFVWIIDQSSLGEDVRFTTAYHRSSRLGGAGHSSLNDARSNPESIPPSQVTDPLASLWIA